MDGGILEVVMIAYIIVCSVALTVAAYMLFSGSGLGTRPKPAFVIFFPVMEVVGATAVYLLRGR